MDVTPIPFTYDIAGAINGEQAGVRIAGTIAANEVRFETSVTTPSDHAPLLWDEHIIAAASIEPLILFSRDLDSIRKLEAPSTFRIEAGLYDDGDKSAGRLVVVGMMEWCAVGDDDDGDEGGDEEEGTASGARLVIRAQLVDGWLNFEPGERVTHVGESQPLSVLPAELGRVVATRTWAVETSRGSSYAGTSVSRL